MPKTSKKWNKKKKEFLTETGAQAAAAAAAPEGERGVLPRARSASFVLAEKTAGTPPRPARDH